MHTKICMYMFKISRNVIHEIVDSIIPPLTIFFFNEVYVGIAASSQQPRPFPTERGKQYNLYFRKLLLNTAGIIKKNVRICKN